jgi:RNA polymerase sigma factor (sigma-70 family)
MSNTRKVAVAEAGNGPTSVLTDAQVSAFWNWVIANDKPAWNMAAHFVRKRDARDVVHTAAILFIESLQRPVSPRAFPKSEGEFRRRFLVIIRNHALDCVRDGDARERGRRFREGVDAEPRVGGRNTPDRRLDRVFARNDTRKYDAPAGAWAPDQHEVDELEEILTRALAGITQMQRNVLVEAYLKGQKRAQVAARFGISVKTYDSTVQAAFDLLRFDLDDMSFDAGELDRSAWWDRIDQLHDAYWAWQAPRLEAKWAAEFAAKDAAAAAEAAAAGTPGADAA